MYGQLGIVRRKLRGLPGRLGDLRKQFAERAQRSQELLSLVLAGAHHDLTIVTGADSSHAASLLQMLASVRQHEPDVPVIAYDLGMAAQDLERLRSRFPTVVLKTFEYARYPSYFNIKINAGEYAWKPVIIADTLDETKRSVCWMDAGNVVLGKLTWIRRVLNATGFYSPRSSGTLRDWTHPKTLAYLRADDALLDSRNLNGACIAISCKHENAMAMARRWAECAKTRECIAPEGSSRANHRQDQAVLSVLAHQFGLTARVPTEYLGFLTHQDLEKH
jgi:uncharacterized protein DUF1647